MDFGTLLYAAQKNERNINKDVKCYRTTFEPPKKEVKVKELSVNIKKFLEKKKEEERHKLDEANKKRDELLALRSQDKKSFKRVQTMLKRTKSANKSVMEDAIDDVNTAVTMAGPSQPDEDDYGYVSQEASAMFDKMMNKYANIPDDPKFAKAKKTVVKDLNAAKDRVRAALERVKEEESLPHKRKRKSKAEKQDEAGAEDEDNFIDDGVLKYEESQEEVEGEPKEAKFKIPKRIAPTPMDFSELLKIAEKKQFEPIVIEKKVDLKKDEPERLMTKKQKAEYLKEKERRQGKGGHILECTLLSTKNKQVAIHRTPKISESKHIEKKVKNKEMNYSVSPQTSRGPTNSGSHVLQNRSRINVLPTKVLKYTNSQSQNVGKLPKRSNSSPKRSNSPPNSRSRVSNHSYYHANSPNRVPKRSDSQLQLQLSSASRVPEQSDSLTNKSKAPKLSDSAPNCSIRAMKESDCSALKKSRISIESNFLSYNRGSSSNQSDYPQNYNSSAPKEFNSSSCDTSRVTKSSVSSSYNRGSISKRSDSLSSYKAKKVSKQRNSPMYNQSNLTECSSSLKLSNKLSERFNSTEYNQSRSPKCSDLPYNKRDRVSGSNSPDNDDSRFTKHSDSASDNESRLSIQSDSATYHSSQLSNKSDSPINSPIRQSEHSDSLLNSPCRLSGHPDSPFNNNSRISNHSESMTYNPSRVSENQNSPLYKPKSPSKHSISPSYTPTRVLSHSNSPSYNPSKTSKHSKSYDPSRVSNHSDSRSYKPHKVSKHSDYPPYKPHTISNHSDYPSYKPTKMSNSCDSPSYKPSKVSKHSTSSEYNPSSVSKHSSSSEYNPGKMSKRSDSPSYIPSKLTKHSDSPTYKPSTLSRNPDSPTYIPSRVSKTSHSPLQSPNTLSKDTDTVVQHSATQPNDSLHSCQNIRSKPANSPDNLVKSEIMSEDEDSGTENSDRLSMHSDSSPSKLVPKSSKHFESPPHHHTKTMKHHSKYDTTPKGSASSKSREKHCNSLNRAKEETSVSHVKYSDPLNSSPDPHDSLNKPYSKHKMHELFNFSDSSTRVENHQKLSSSIHRAEQKHGYISNKVSSSAKRCASPMTDQKSKIPKLPDEAKKRDQLRPGIMVKPIKTSDESSNTPTMPSAAERLKKSADVWTKPCNLMPPKDLGRKTTTNKPAKRPPGGLLERTVPEGKNELGERQMIAPEKTKELEGRLQDTPDRRKELEPRRADMQISRKDGIPEKIKELEEKQLGLQKKQRNMIERRDNVPHKRKEWEESRMSFHEKRKEVDEARRLNDLERRKELDTKRKGDQEKRPLTISDAVREEVLESPLKAIKTQSSQCSSAKVNKDRNLLRVNGLQPGAHRSNGQLRRSESGGMRGRPLTQAEKEKLMNRVDAATARPKDVSPKQSAPADAKARQFPSPDVKRKQQTLKRRIIDDDSESEHDSDRDFIDDEPGEAEDYSKYIKEIFGYDRKKYANIDDDDDIMESNFSHILKEEAISTHIGAMEDLEELKKEQEEKKRGMMRKKQRR